MTRIREEEVVNPVAVTALLPRSFYIAANKEYLTNKQTVFRCVDSAFSQLYISLKSVGIFKSYGK